MFKTYLGDGVYAEFDKWRGVVLTTENGFCATNTIVLEPEVLHSFDEWAKAVRTELAAQCANEDEGSESDAKGNV